MGPECEILDLELFFWIEILKCVFMSYEAKHKQKQNHLVTKQLGNKWLDHNNDKMMMTQPLIFRL